MYFSRGASPMKWDCTRLRGCACVLCMRLTFVFFPSAVPFTLNPRQETVRESCGKTRAMGSPCAREGARHDVYAPFQWLSRLAGTTVLSFAQGLSCTVSVCGACGACGACGVAGLGRIAGSEPGSVRAAAAAVSSGAGACLGAPPPGVFPPGVFPGLFRLCCID